MEYKFLQCEDGIYFAKPLENGNMSDDAIMINDEDIVNLFLNYLKRYCYIKKKDLLQIINSKNELVMEAKLHIAGITN